MSCARVLSGYWWLRSPNNNNSNNARNVNNNGNINNNNNVNNTNNGVVPDLFLICQQVKKQPALCGKYHARVLETKEHLSFPVKGRI
jgi:hypothetical protein